MRVLVTGGTGYLGRAIVRSLVARQHAVVVYARSASRSGVPGTPIDGDIRDETALRRAAQGCDAICHAAALVSVWHPRRAEFDEVNVGGLENVIRAVRVFRLTRCIYTASFLALPPSDGTGEQRANDYQRTKVEASHVAHRAIEDGLPFVCTYPGVVYGPGPRTEGNLMGRLIGDHLAGRLPGLIGADRRWSFAYVDDVADAHAAALERGRIGARYTLGGENVPQLRVFEIVRDLTGRPLPRRIPYAVARAIAAFEEARATMFRRPPLLTMGVVDIFRHDWVLDSELAARDLDYRVTPLAEGLARMVSELTRGPASPHSP